MTYYVIRNLDTGAYWRGKGFTWGKHFNQAVIYRERRTAENTLERIFRMGFMGKIVPIQITEVRE